MFKDKPTDRMYDLDKHIQNLKEEFRSLPDDVHPERRNAITLEIQETEEEYWSLANHT